MFSKTYNCARSDTRFAAMEDLFSLFTDLQFNLQFAPSSRCESFTRSAPHLKLPGIDSTSQTSQTSQKLVLALNIIKFINLGQNLIRVIRFHQRPQT